MPVFLVGGGKVFFSLQWTVLFQLVCFGVSVGSLSADCTWVVSLVVCMRHPVWVLLPVGLRVLDSSGGLCGRSH